VVLNLSVDLKHMDMLCRTGLVGVVVFQHGITVLGSQKNVCLAITARLLHCSAIQRSSGVFPSELATSAWGVGCQAADACIRARGVHVCVGCADDAQLVTCFVLWSAKLGLALEEHKQTAVV
jgi:hypothetical protein